MESSTRDPREGREDRRPHAVASRAAADVATPGTPAAAAKSRIPVLDGSSLAAGRETAGDAGSRALLRVALQDAEREVAELRARLAGRAARGAEAGEKRQREALKKKLKAVQELSRGQGRIIERQARENAEAEFALRCERRRVRELLDDAERAGKGQHHAARLAELEVSLAARDARIRQLEDEKEAVSRELLLAEGLSATLRAEKRRSEATRDRALEERRASDAKCSDLTQLVDLLQRENDSLRRAAAWDGRGGAFQVSSPRQRDKALLGRKSLSPLSNNSASNEQRDSPSPDTAAATLQSPREEADLGPRPPSPPVPALGGQAGQQHSGVKLFMPIATSTTSAWG